MLEVRGASVYACFFSYYGFGVLRTLRALRRRKLDIEPVWCLVEFSAQRDKSTERIVTTYHVCQMGRGRLPQNSQLCWSGWKDVWKTTVHDFMAWGALRRATQGITRLRSCLWSKKKVRHGMIKYQKTEGFDGLYVGDEELDTFGSDLGSEISSMIIDPLTMRGSTDGSYLTEP